LTSVCNEYNILLQQGQEQGRRCSRQRMPTPF
jgi:hypothetical protein